jgi:hypothetical protein
MIYETKGLTLEQIDELYAEVKVASQSVHWTPTTTFTEIRASVAAQGGLGQKGALGHHEKTGEADTAS